MQKLREMHPNLNIAGYRHGYFSEDESPQVVETIRRSGAQMLFVAMSSPRKEHWLGEHGPALGVPFAMGVGGSIDIVAGITRRVRPSGNAWGSSGSTVCWRSLGGCSGAIS